MSGATNTLQWPVQRAAKSRDGANPIKAGLSSDSRLKLACLKSESLVTVSQHITVNTFPGLVQNKCAWQRIGLDGANPSLERGSCEQDKSGNRLSEGLYMQTVVFTDWYDQSTISSTLQSCT